MRATSSVLVPAVTTTTSSTLRILPHLLACCAINPTPRSAVQGAIDVQQAAAAAAPIKAPTHSNHLLPPPPLPSALADALPQLTLPNHLAVVLDGNSRWAKSRNLPTAAGHVAGVQSMRNLVGNCLALGPSISTLTVYAFSTENWGRPQDEVDALLGLIEGTLRSEADELYQRGVRLQFLGEVERLPPHFRSLCEQLEEKVPDQVALTLCVALSYGGRSEIAATARALAQRVEAGEMSADDIDEDSFAEAMRSESRSAPCDPDLVVRTGNRKRLSNFLLYQCAYAELYFSEAMWPEFGGEELAEALLSFQTRRRTGGVMHEGPEG